ncbi:hypothetical protein BJ165DRAFT_1338181 [Panaeolus papilionaceus]|nr:hypothetical protein BJ165DRAFT_1338181 [Panaeolus papilionaceus]
MSKRNFAVSRSVNPPGVTPVLSEEQLWRGLEIKARDPQQFVAAMSECTIQSDTGDKVVRIVRFGGGEPVQEDILIYQPTILYFDSPDKGHRVTNVVSYDKNSELVLTFSFAGGFPAKVPLADNATPVEVNAVIGNAVESTLKRIRELVNEGKI